jgi:hypothetical protein
MYEDALAYARQAKEWYDSCASKHHCPCGDFFGYMMSLMDRIDRLEAENEAMRQNEES